MVPPYSDRVSRAPSYSSSWWRRFRVPDYHRLWWDFPDPSTNRRHHLRAAPRSLAATKGISVDFFSSGYLDVSVLRVCFLPLWIQGRMTRFSWPGFPIRTSAGQSVFANSPRLIACYNVLHRLLLPRHPPYALIHLTI
jgi:hypothetical protein